MKRLISLIQPGIVAIVIAVLLTVTGLASTVSFLAQSAMLKTGLRDASDVVDDKQDDFDFDFSVRKLDGKRMKFSDLKGKVIFLNLWATWCGPCRAEMPTIQALYQKADTSQVAFVILSVDRDSDQPKVVRYIEKNKFSFPVFSPSGYLTEQLNVPTIPTTFIISKQGKVVSKEVGSTNFDTERFRKFLKKLAAKG